MILDDDLYKNILDNVDSGVYFVDIDRKITYWNKGAENITGFKSSEVIGYRCCDNILVHIDEHGNNICFGLCPLAETIRNGQVHKNELYLHHKAGYRIPVFVNIIPIKDSNGNNIGAVEIFKETLPQKNDAVLRIKELQKLALLDSLTELGNRRYAESNLKSKFDEMKRYGLSFGVLFVDIDHFKKVNDTYGHDIGDKVLKIVSRTLSGNVRPFDVVSRWGGEEFLLIIAHVKDEEQLYNIAHKLLVLVEKSELVEGGNIIKVTVSIGATLARLDDKISSLVKRADKLMYHSKKSGRNCISMRLAE